MRYIKFWEKYEDDNDLDDEHMMKMIMKMMIKMMMIKKIEEDDEYVENEYSQKMQKEKLIRMENVENQPIVENVEYQWRDCRKCRMS